ncbi:ABC transporter permease [Halolamina salifodinae]|uniref:Peptide/nickel transport system permease protein n=1 Tax=Halolamina salifodinae TaxID=1202767 RepID=A0A8T4H0D0_9EURY|nr:ABC transporter permease [Halolamina salifodinae]MBP1987045.1 peptide/nickel transport system permease protein [Halolamina salifodinae]
MSEPSPPDAGRFTAVDWDEFDASDGAPAVPRWLPVGAVVLLAAFGYDYLTADGLPVVMSGLDWLLALGLYTFGSVAVAALLGAPAQVAHYWGQFRKNRIAVACLAFLTAFVTVGLFGPLLVGEPEVNVLYSSQPPVWGSIDTAYVPSCVGEVVDGRCQGSWQYPLGTTAIDGKDMIALLVLGTRTSLSVALGAATIVVPTGVGAGVAAAALGGRVESAILWLAEQLQTFPAVLIYFVLFYWLVDGRLRLLIGALGLVGWGGLARLVHDEIRVRRNEQYAQAAELGGVGEHRLLGRHLLPNVLPSVLSNVTLQIPLFVLVEATISFIQIPVSTGSTTLGDPSNFSWGQLIYSSLFTVGLPAAWWLAGIPLLLLALTVFSFNVVGDAMVEALEPRDGT